MAALPVLPAEPKIRPSRSARWRAAVLIGIHLLIAAHLTHWLVSGRTLTPLEPSEGIAFSRDSIVNAGLIFFAATIALTAVFGRFFCGWACHLVALQDLARWLLLKLGIRPKPLRSRLLRVVPVLAFVYMFLWPAAYRLWTGASFRPVQWEITTSQFWATFPGWVIGGLTFLVCGFVIIYFLGAKGFCTYACPYGAIFGAVERLAPLRIRVTDACAGCGHCTAVCSSNVRVHEEVRDFGMVVDPGCMKCLDCVSVCPNDALYYGRGPIPLLAGRRSSPPATPHRRLSGWDEAVLGVAFLAAFVTFRGLYDSVPFLLSLGLSAILAYLMLVTVQLARKPHLALREFRLKRDGRLLPAGYGFLAALALVLAFWGHSAFVHYHAFRGQQAWRSTAELRARALDVNSPPRPLQPADRQRVAQAQRHLELAQRWGLVDAPGSNTRLAWLGLLAGSSESLQHWAARALAREGSQAEVFQLLARDAWAHGDLAAAARAYEQAIAAAPQAAEPYVSLGVILAGSGQLDAAEQVFARGLQHSGPSPQLVYNVGVVKAMQGLPEAAASYFEQTLALDPDNLRARENLAGMLATLGRFSESADHYRRALAETPGDHATRVLLARVLLAAGQLEAARSELVEALRLDPGQAEAQQLLDQLNLEAQEPAARPGNGRQP